jgi:hypothetical protein
MITATSPSESLEASAAPPLLHQEDTISYTREDLVSFGWPSIAGGIILAGFIYPSILGLIYLIIAGAIALTYPISSIDADTFGGMIMAVFGIAFVGTAVGAIWTSIVCLPTIFLAHLVVWSMHLRPDFRRLGAVVGGLVGFLAVSPITLIPMLDRGGVTFHWGLMLFLMSGPGLTTFLGQWGGAIGGRRAARSFAIAVQKSTALSNAASAEAGRLAVEQFAKVHPVSPKFQFQIWHLLWISFWLSVLLSVIRLSGVPYALLLPTLIVWLLYQAMTLMLVERIERWRQSRRLSTMLISQSASL